VLVVTSALERWFPHDRGWNPPLGELRQDAAYLAIAAVLQPVARLAAHAGAVVIALALADHAPVRPWLSGVSPWARAALALGLADLGKYALHRLAHEHAWLWRFHAEHHAPARMHALNGVRLHPVNLLWNLALDAAAPLALGLDGHAIVIIAVVRGTVAVLQHANVALRLGPLSWVLSTPDLHEFHHSADVGQASSNFGSTLIVWDVLFGTRRLPPGRPARLGLAGDAVQPRRLWNQLVWPWCGSRAETCRLVQR
jgi:sterol desaturase/sphingolipid hydroxylase (fatty acid hydroxylase superfamily)